MWATTQMSPKIFQLNMMTFDDMSRSGQIDSKWYAMTKAYIKKRRTPIRVFPVSNVYKILLLSAHAYNAFQKYA